MVMLVRGECALSHLCTRRQHCRCLCCHRPCLRCWLCGSGGHWWLQWGAEQQLCSVSCEGGLEMGMRLSVRQQLHFVAHAHSHAPPMATTAAKGWRSCSRQSSANVFQVWGQKMVAV